MMNTNLPRQISMLEEICTAYKDQDFKISLRVGKTII